MLPAVTNSLMPELSVAQAKARYELFKEFVSAVLVEGRDFGVIPGVEKPTLLKPGAEKIQTFFGLTTEAMLQEQVMDWDKGLFYFRYTTKVYRHGELLATCDGSANSREPKYRYRIAGRTCPECGEELRRSKRDAEWYCWARMGGCGETFPLEDPRILQQESGKVENPDPAGVINTLQKQAQKRSYVGGVSLASNASDYFTHDVEDMDDGDLGSGGEAGNRGTSPSGGSQRSQTKRKPTAAKKNGHGRMPSITAKEWMPRCQALADEYELYRAPNGKPNGFAIAKMAGELGYSEISDANLDEVISKLAYHAAQQDAPAAAPETDAAEAPEQTDLSREMDSAPAAEDDAANTAAGSTDAA